jgi:hypothetical protein
MLALVAVGVSRCRLATDPVAGAELETSHGSLERCIRRCLVFFGELLRIENIIHEAILRACGGDAACIAKENARHERAVARIEAGRDSCVARCHHQGGGNGR